MGVQSEKPISKTWLLIEDSLSANNLAPCQVESLQLLSPLQESRYLDDKVE